MSRITETLTALCVVGALGAGADLKPKDVTEDGVRNKPVQTEEGIRTRPSDETGIRTKIPIV